MLMFLLAGMAGAGVTEMWAVPQLPEPGLAWKNVTVDGKKTAVYSIFRDSRGIVFIFELSIIARTSDC